jgi:hypothetical protein
MGNTLKKLFEKDKRELIIQAMESQWRKEKKYTFKELGLQHISESDRDMYIREMTWRYNFSYRDWVQFTKDKQEILMCKVIGVIIIKN